jgi:hypothetical protein
MSLAMVGDHASYEFRWRRWALLRDTVLEPTGRYPHFASIGGALGMDSLKIPAAALAAELSEIREVLRTRTVEHLMLGPVTASVLYPTIKLDQPRPLSRAELTHVAPIGEDEKLDQYFASMLDSMADVCAHPAPDGTIEVLDG